MAINGREMEALAERDPYARQYPTKALLRRKFAEGGPGSKRVAEAVAARLSAQRKYLDSQHGKVVSSMDVSVSSKPQTKHKSSKRKSTKKSKTPSKRRKSPLRRSKSPSKRRKSPPSKKRKSTSPKTRKRKK